MRCAAVGLAALAAAVSAVQGLNVTDVLTYSLVCTTHMHKHGRQCLEYTHHDHEAQHKVRANYTKGELRTPRYRWNVYLWTTEEGQEKVKIEKDGADINELRLDEPYCAIRDTTNNAGRMSLEPCKINGTKGEVVDLLEDSWNARVVNSKDKSGNPHFEILSPNKQNCLVANLDSEGNSGYLFAMVGECGTDDSIWIARDFISTAHPTMSPISPTYRPTLESTLGPEDAVPTPGPTAAPSSEVKDIVPRRAFLLREGISGDSSSLGFGISRGDDHEAQKGDKLQLKSFTKLQNKDDVHVSKMMWYMDKAGLIHFGAQPDLVLVDNMHSRHHTDTVMASYMTFVVLKPESEVVPKESVWEMVPRKGAFRIRRKALEDDGTEMCLTVAECNLKDSDSGTHWICQDRGNNPACTESECDKPNCSGDDCICKEFPDRTCRKLEPGAYVKVMKCSSTYDAVQLFNTVDANDWLTPNTPTRSPSDVASTPVPTTKAPTTKAPTTKAPTPEPTSKPTVVKTSPTVAFGSRETDPESSGSAPTIVLLALVGLVGLMVLLVRRKSNDRPYTGRRANSFGGPMDDDDDQGLFDSFDNLNNGLYSQPSSGGSPQRNNTDNAGPSARERMMQGSGGGLQEVPMTHFEQDQGYVARV